MRKIHLAIATNDIEATIADYSRRLDCHPCVVVPHEYALWRTKTVNLSIRRDSLCRPGELRHLGLEDATATAFTQSTDVNGILWENFTAEQQAAEIQAAWPETGSVPNKDV
jgi:hypothetical protein